MKLPVKISPCPPRTYAHVHAHTFRYNRSQDPVEWSGAQSELASLYLKRIRGRRGENLETAIAALERAADVLRTVKPNGPALIKGLGGGSAPAPGSAGGSGGDVKTLHATVLARLGDCYIERRIGNLQENRKIAVDFLSKAVGMLTRETDPWRAANLRLARAQADSDADGVAGANQALNTVSSTLKTVTAEHPLWAEFCWQAARLWIHKARLVAKDAKQKAAANASATGAASGSGSAGGGAGAGAELPKMVAEAVSKALKNARSYLQQGLSIVVDGKGFAESSHFDSERGASPVEPRLEVLMCAELAKIYVQTNGDNAVQSAAMAAEMVERAMDVLEAQPGLQLLNTLERRTALSVALAEAQEKAGELGEAASTLRTYIRRGAGSLLARRQVCRHALAMYAERHPGDAEHGKIVQDESTLWHQLRGAFLAAGGVCAQRADEAEGSRKIGDWTWSPPYGEESGDEMHGGGADGDSSEEEGGGGGGTGFGMIGMVGRMFGRKKRARNGKIADGGDSGGESGAESEDEGLGGQIYAEKQDVPKPRVVGHARAWEALRLAGKIGSLRAIENVGLSAGQGLLLSGVWPKNEDDDEEEDEEGEGEGEGGGGGGGSGGRGGGRRRRKKAASSSTSTADAPLSSHAWKAASELSSRQQSAFDKSHRLLLRSVESLSKDPSLAELASNGGLGAFWRDTGQSPSVGDGSYLYLGVGFRVPTGSYTAYYQVVVVLPNHHCNLLNHH